MTISKRINYLTQAGLLACLLCVGMLSSCKSDDETATAPFGVDKETLSVPEDGSVETLTVEAVDGNKWTASIDRPWVQITPSNGEGTQECRVKVDNSVADLFRTATIRLTDSYGNVKNVTVTQSGHKLGVVPEKADTLIENSAALDKRNLKIKVVTNVKFTVRIDYETSDGGASSQWLSFDNRKLDINLEYGKRPVTVELTLPWNINTDTDRRKATVNFIPSAEDGVDVSQVITKPMTVTQKGAPVITDDRAGDSLALITIAQRLGNLSWDTSQKMDMWSNVTLWEPTDDAAIANPEMAGRVRSAKFGMIATKETIPFEVTKLKYVETLAFTSNQNPHLLKVSLGTSLNDLRYLKSVSFMGYGFADINDLKSSTLEYLEMNSNSFTEIPAVLTKANFPSLRTLKLNSNRITSTMDMRNTTEGLKFELMKDAVQTTRFLNLLAWDLDTLQIGVNYITGRMPTADELAERGFTDTWKAGDRFIDYNDKERQVPNDAHIVGQPKLLSKTRFFSINLNYLTGNLPDWILYHPHLYDWNPYTFIFNQESAEGFLENGKRPGFYNEPTNLNYYYEVYPFRKVSTDETVSKTRLRNIRKK